MRALVILLVLVGLRDGRAQRAASRRGRERTPNLNKLYSAALPNYRPGEFDFRFTLVRGPGKARLVIDRSVESVEWIDEQATLSGSIVLRRPDPNDRWSMPIGKGHRVKCEVRGPSVTAAWRTLWFMRVSDREVEPMSGTVSCELLDDLDLVRRNERDWNLRVGKRHPKGRLGHEWAAIVCEKGNIPVLALAECKTRIRKLRRRDASPLEMLRRIYRREREETHRRFVIRWASDASGREGIEVAAFKRNESLYVFEKLIAETLLRQEGSARPYTVLKAKGKVGKGSNAKTIRATVARRDIVKRFGRVVREHDFGRVDNKAELEEKAKRRYAKAIEVKRRIDGLEVPGVPWIRRGHGCEVRLPDEGYSGRDAFVFVTRVSHRVDGRGYWTNMDLGTEDPFLADRERREEELREERERDRDGGS